MRPVLILFLRRLDKMMSKIHKNQRIYVSVDWAAVSVLLAGLYDTVWRYPHVIVSLPNFKNLLTTCQVSTTVLQFTPEHLCSTWRRGRSRHRSRASPQTVAGWLCPRQSSVNK